MSAERTEAEAGMEPPRLLILGAHPDDAEFHAGGLASLYRRLGNTVKMVSVTNGGGAIKLSQEFGAHFSGYAAGPAAGVVVQQELLGYGYFGLTVAPKFTWDIQVLKDIGLYVSPNVAIGYHRSRWQGHPAFTGGDIQGGVALKLALGDRGLVYTQLPHFDFVFGPGYSMVRYDFILGVGLSF